jgi:hypothetical protein
MTPVAARFAAVMLLLCAVTLHDRPASGHETEPSGDVVRAWNALARDTIHATNGVDAQAARLYAMLNVAIYDAVNGTVSHHGSSERETALVPPDGAPRNADPVASAAAAAHAVLVGIYPARAGIYDAELAVELAALGSGRHVSSATTWGERVAAAVLAARANDGSSPNETQDAGTGPGVFRAAWSAVQFRNLAPFAIVDPNVYVSPGPPDLTTLDYAAAFAEVKLLGNAAIPDAEKLATFQYWSLGANTNQPPGAWTEVASIVSSSRGMSLAETARLFALVTMAMCDTVAPTYKTKFIYRHWRPATAIREADTDNNPNTTADPTWAPRAGGIGGTPEHWSGHSSFSGAAARVLSGFFCDDAISFSLVTDSAPGAQPRTYPSFSAAEAEAGRSRVVGGIHFEFSNQAGLAAGHGVAAEVLATKLLRKHGPTHLGSCPL